MVGVVREEKQDGIEERGRINVYIDMKQCWGGKSITLVFSLSMIHKYVQQQDILEKNGWGHFLLKKLKLKQKKI